MIKRLAATVFLLLASDALADAPEWSYSGDDDEWAAASKDFAACSIGTSQSPVNISYTTLSDLPTLAFHYADTSAHIAMLDRTLVVTLKEGGTLTLDKNKYRFTQIRFHTPSEHPVLGKNYPLEIHLIHRDENGKILIVAVLAELGDENAALQAILAGISDKTPELSLNAKALIPQASGYYAYTGSLSWPPCTEGVEWRILKKTITVSQPQFKQLAQLLSRNARLPQPVYMRTIFESKD